MARKFTAALVVTAGIGLWLAGGSTAEAGDPWHLGFRIGGTTIGFGHGGGFRGHRGHYDWHDTSHYDWHPGGFQPHGNHYHYVPGHYDFHRDGHWDFHPQGHWDYHRGHHGRRHGGHRFHRRH